MDLKSSGSNYSLLKKTVAILITSIHGISVNADKMQGKHLLYF